MVAPDRVMLVIAEMLGHLLLERGLEDLVGELVRQPVRADQLDPLLLGLGQELLGQPVAGRASCLLLPRSPACQSWSVSSRIRLASSTVFLTVPVSSPNVIGRIDEVVIDCANPESLAKFWARVLGGEPIERDEAWWYILPPGWTQLSFQKVPEVKMVKNRLHLDVLVEDVTAATSRAQLLGARCVGDVHYAKAGTFQVLLDPEGNEWCVVVPASAPQYSDESSPTTH
jgi:hypothetical protein